MGTITENMAADHRRCDELFADAEMLVDKSDWQRGSDHFKEFRDAMGHHFAMEEEVLFPSFEACTGQTAGPTQVMRMEHMQMRQLLTDMLHAVEREDREVFLGLSETLMILMQQHNMKEEQMLYPMADRVLAPDVEAVIRKMESL